ncbi:mandelate racemase/muconate lactonizing enzyme family protein [Algicella marina]|uniref:Mandelate racemase/muconate lactonizing enzyme family protein n=1 Tax=Algicella marina TaxID=2683284 RepID=A0A6P1STF9_9RHOB|nr:mandelate racemase/muconate lactonizing enzyme family protein [Algicella marina]QHQ33964.1 mandelate racemase/muconate lactonizing enzyme family protein [Algicella marina]
MHLTDLDILVTGNPPPCHGGRYFIFVKLTTSNGITGWGEVYAATVGPAAMSAVIGDVFSRHMQGRSPEQVEAMFRAVYSAGFSQRPDPTVMGAFSGLEIACWDIIGKARERPVHALLGGRLGERLRAYTYLYPAPGEDARAFYTSPDRSATAAAVAVARGYTAVKFDPAGPYTIMGGHQPLPEDLATAARFCTEIRGAVGDRADLLFGTHGQFTPSGAIRMAHAIAPSQPLWFEEPVPPDNPAAMAQVARHSPVPIATGERLTTRADFWPLLRDAACGIIQPATGRVGGIWEGRKLAALAETAGAQFAPHLYAGPVEWAANIHLAATCPNTLMVETIETPFHDSLIGGAIRVEEGFITVPDAPGLGIDFDEALARAHPCDSDSLHLEMQPTPYMPGPSDWAGG